jgi:hypothetical protein
LATILVGDFGECDGIRTFRINGKKEDLQRIINECHKINAEIINSAEIEHVRKNDWSVLLKIRIAAKVSEVG